MWRAAECLHADRLGLLPTAACTTISLFTVVRTVVIPSLGFIFVQKMRFETSVPTS